MNRKKFKATLTIFMILFTIIGGSILSFAQSYPTKPIELVIPFAPGGGADISSRIFSKYSEEYLGQPIVVKNITGAGGSLAGLEVLNSKPDGYRLLYNHEALHVSYHTGIADFTWDSFTPICEICFSEQVFFVKGDAPWNNLKDLMDYIQQNPGDVKIGVDFGATSHFTAISLDNALGGKKLLTEVSTGGDGDRIKNILGNSIQVAPSAISSVVDYLASGDLKVLAVLNEDRRSEFMPDMPTAIEQGYDIKSVFNFQIFAPKGLPQEIANTISEAFEKMCKDERIVQELNNMYATPLYLNQEELRNKLLEMDVEHYKIARVAGLID